MTVQLKPALMPIKAEHDREQQKTKAQNNRLIEHFVGGSSHKLKHCKKRKNTQLQKKT